MFIMNHLFHLLNLNLLNLLFYKHVSLNLFPGKELQKNPQEIRPKISLLGSSIARNYGRIIAANSSSKNTC